MKDFSLSLCQDTIGGEPAFWTLAQKTWTACMKYSFLADLQTKLHHALINLHDPQAGWKLLQKGLDWLDIHAAHHKPMYPAAALGVLLPEAILHYGMLGVSMEAVRATFGDMTRWISVYVAQHHGAYGVDEISWIVHPYAGTIFALGSLQYQTIGNPFPYYAFAADGNVWILPAGGLPIDETGHICGTNGKRHTPAFYTKLTVKPQGFWGNHIDTAAALIHSTEIAVPAKAKLLLAPSLPILNMHIPAGADLSPQAIDKSIQLAKDFFPTIGFPSNAVVCDSWMLDPCVENMLSHKGRIAAFAQRFMRFPVQSEQYSHCKFLFGTDLNGLSKAVPKSSLQACVQAHLLHHGELFDTCGITLID